jgi:hypothetical protein
MIVQALEGNRLVSPIASSDVLYGWGGFTKTARICGWRMWGKNPRLSQRLARIARPRIYDGKP